MHQVTFFIADSVANWIASITARLQVKQIIADRRIILDEKSSYIREIPKYKNALLEIKFKTEINQRGSWPSQHSRVGLAKLVLAELSGNQNGYWCPPSRFCWLCWILPVVWVRLPDGFFVGRFLSSKPNIRKWIMLWFCINWILLNWFVKLVISGLLGDGLCIEGFLWNHPLKKMSCIPRLVIIAR